ncbi:hypothetical protein SCP_1403350 [Sparassis crispa]|uniref:Uncharacterized protein n=1 Tax=Sparassis crispa TaxID=139825 RepID=A0A401H3B8_9APHY|nr:hypothetical protein SCP_1403350 [Sparassis crispa]GBE88927.1 hypothetical protein SCP_1403350 [Sparassis crispa]
MTRQYVDDLNQESERSAGSVWGPLAHDNGHHYGNHFVLEYSEYIAEALLAVADHKRTNKDITCYNRAPEGSVVYPEKKMISSLTKISPRVDYEGYDFLFGLKSTARGER